MVNAIYYNFWLHFVVGFCCYKEMQFIYLCVCWPYIWQPVDIFNDLGIKRIAGQMNNSFFMAKEYTNIEYKTKVTLWFRTNTQTTIDNNLYTLSNSFAFSKYVPLLPHF